MKDLEKCLHGVGWFCSVISHAALGIPFSNENNPSYTMKTAQFDLCLLRDMGVATVSKREFCEERESPWFQIDHPKLGLIEFQHGFNSQAKEYVNIILDGVKLI